MAKKVNCFICKEDKKISEVLMLSINMGEYIQKIRVYACKKHKGVQEEYDRQVIGKESSGKG